MELDYWLGLSVLIIGAMVLRFTWVLSCLWFYDSHGANIGKISHLYNKIKERL